MNLRHCSGPITVKKEEESLAIQAAPAYDVEAARALIPCLPAIRAMADTLPERAELTAFGQKRPSEAVLRRVEAEIRGLCAGGHQVSMIMADLNTRSGVAYRPGVTMCSQSIIKAIYVGALLDSRPEALTENGRDMREAIVYSANEPYHRLRETYGVEPLLRWCEEAGVDAGFAEMLYPRNRSARDMFKMWTRLYCYLNGGADQANFGAYFADSRASAAGELFRGRVPVQTKAGWECGVSEDQDYDPETPVPPEYTDGDPMNDECAINDSGVVYTEKGPYLFVIYTDHPYGIFRNGTPPNPLLPLTEVLLALQKSLAESSDTGAEAETD